MRQVYLIVAVICAAAGGVGYFALMNQSPVRFGSQSIPESIDAWRLIIGFLLTLFGVVIGVFYRNLQEKKRSGKKQIESAKGMFFEIVYSIDLWIGFCGAPLVFALLMQSTQGATWPGLVAVALQNGFCCAIIAYRFMADSGAKPSSS